MWDGNDTTRADELVVYGWLSSIIHGMKLVYGLRIEVQRQDFMGEKSSVWYTIVAAVVKEDVIICDLQL